MQHIFSSLGGNFEADDRFVPLRSLSDDSVEHELEILLRLFDLACELSLYESLSFCDDHAVLMNTALLRNHPLHSDDHRNDDDDDEGDVYAFYNGDENEEAEVVVGNGGGSEESDPEVEEVGWEWRGNGGGGP